MFGNCPYPCNNKTEDGYCLFTACKNPKYQNNASLADMPLCFEVHKFICYDKTQGFVLLKDEQNARYVPVKSSEITSEHYDLLLYASYNDAVSMCATMNETMHTNYEPREFVIKANEITTVFEDIKTGLWQAVEYVKNDKTKSE